jgi:hypothetical protein
MFFNRTKNVQLWRYCNLFCVNRFDVEARISSANCAHCIGTTIKCYVLFYGDLEWKQKRDCVRNKIIKKLQNN